MTSPISPVADQSQGSTTNTSSLGTAGLLDPSTFLSLLVDELKYQNPLDPTSSSDFMSQIAQLSQVEQLSSVSSASQMDEAAGLIGKTVSANDESGDYDLRRRDRCDQWQLGPAAQRGQPPRSPSRTWSRSAKAAPRADMASHRIRPKALSRPDLTESTKNTANPTDHHEKEQPMSVRSLGAAASGIDTMQTDLDTIGNDIANSETDGFKSGTAEFQDLLTEQLQPAGAPAGTSLASTNPQRSVPAPRCRRSPRTSRRARLPRRGSARMWPLRATASSWSARTGRPSTPGTATCRSTPTGTLPPRGVGWSSAGRRDNRPPHPRDRSASSWDRPKRQQRRKTSTWAATFLQAPPRR